MRLFYALCRRKNMPNGHIYRGKNKIIKPVTIDELCEFKRELEVQEKNMFYLRHAYLTPEQSKGHAKALKKPEQRFIEMITAKKTFYDNVTLESRLGHLRYKEGWD